MKFQRSPLVCVALTLLFSCALCRAAPLSYTVTDLGAPEDGFSGARAINNRGQVMGVVALTRDSLKTAFVWTNGRRVDLGTLPGYLTSIPSAINDAGEVTGDMDTGHNRLHAFLARQGKLRDLGTLPGDTDSSGFAINARGDIRGSSWRGLLGNESCREFLFHDGAMKNLGKLRSIWPVSDRALGKLRGFDGITILGRNRRGDVTGCAYGDGYKNGRPFYGQAFVYRRGRLFQLKAPSAFVSFGRGLNNKGEVVGGFSSKQTGGACLWKNGKLVNLNALLPPNSGWHLIEAHGINDAGQIVGDGIHNGKRRAFLLTSHFP